LLLLLLQDLFLLLLGDVNLALALVRRRRHHRRLLDLCGQRNSHETQRERESGRNGQELRQQDVRLLKVGC
jgi:hypothetical protein